MWPLIAELAWLAPARFTALIVTLQDASLNVLRRRFDADFRGTGEIQDYAWFPAWLLIIKPAVAGRFGRRAYRAICRHHVPLPYSERFCVGNVKVNGTN